MPVFDATMIPDLLHPHPRVGWGGGWRIDFDRTKLAVNLAFAGGTASGLFSEALESSALAPSRWQPANFANDLFLARFVSQGFRIRIGHHQPVPITNHLVRLVAHPPADPGILLHRRAILAELTENSVLRKELEALYLSIGRLRALLENASGTRTWDATRRQLDILLIAKEIFDSMSSGFASATSGLRCLYTFGARVQASGEYHALYDLLRYDARLATLHLKVGIGADGKIRGFEVLSTAEDRDNPFVNPPWRRWLAKCELFLRGYRFGDAEIMARLVDAVFAGLEDEFVVLVQLFGDLEFYLGALGFRDQAEAAGLAVCLPEIVAPEEPRLLFGLFNPLLLMSGVVPVPCDVVTDRLTATVLVTGPNSGGKTRLLQSVGLAQILAQAGLFIPARSGSVALTDSLVVSLIQETRADQSEGRLGTELLRIRELFERLPPGAMVLLDELCSGTNPSEGEEIFELVVAMLTRLRPQAFITTHFLTFAARLERQGKIPDLGFLQVELGPDRRPTYQFAPGVASTSLAGQAAERLGVTGEQLMTLIERNIRRERAVFPGAEESN
jgi:DNA mismatch repair protein MutS2